MHCLDAVTTSAPSYKEGDMGPKVLLYHECYFGQYEMTFYEEAT